MKDSRGFSLPELLVSAALFSLMMLLTGMILRGGEEQARQSEFHMHLRDNAQGSLYKMALEIRESSPARTTVSNGGSLLTIQIPSAVSSSGSITWSNPITYRVRVNADGARQLIREVTNPANNQILSTTVLASDIQTVAFTPNGAPPATITMAVTAQRTMTNGRVLSISSTGGARIRNP